MNKISLLLYSDIRSFSYLILQQANQSVYIIFRTHFKPLTKRPNDANTQ